MNNGVIVYVLRDLGHRREVLFLLRSGGKFAGQWWPVAGTSQLNELPLDTALRELKEETALIAEKVYAFNFEIRHEDDQSELSSYVAFVSADSTITLNYEHTAYQWLTADEATNIVPKAVRETIEHLGIHFMDQAVSDVAARAVRPTR